MGGVVALVMVGAAFLYAQIDIARQSIQLDLRLIGESIYEAHARSGRWPARIEDLSETEYLNLSHRRAMLEAGHFVVVWHDDLNPQPDGNHERVLAYDDRSLLSRFGSVWVCRGDLRVERMDADALQVYLSGPRDGRREAEPSSAAEP